MVLQLLLELKFDFGAITLHYTWCIEQTSLEGGPMNSSEKSPYSKSHLLCLVDRVTNHCSIEEMRCDTMTEYSII